MARKSPINLWCLLIMLCLTILSCGCQLPQQAKPEQQVGPKQVVKDIKPEVYPIPEGVSKALPGLQNDNIYIYREISPSINLVAYVPDYSLEGAVKMAAEAFTSLLDNPKFSEGIDFWIVQIQPKADDDARILVWGVRPEEAKSYKESGEMEVFFQNSEYVSIDDKIIPKGSQRSMVSSAKAPAAAAEGQKGEKVHE